MYCYQKLENQLKKKNITKTDLCSILNISSRTIAKINKNEKISSNVLIKIANYLKCDIKDLYEEKSNNKVLQILREEKNNKISGGLYHELQIQMTYNSNHIEGSKLSKDQTRQIFETKTIDSDNILFVDDIIETKNHFRAIDYCIDNAEKELDEEIIKHLHYLLKQNTSDSDLSWFNVGDYKTRENFVGGNKTTKPKEVSKKINKLLQSYNEKGSAQFEDIVDFHYQFECIHPFQDGNGRVGRLIALKECLKNNIIPFIIEDSKKAYYYRGLKNYKDEKGWLIDTCLDGQDHFEKLLKKLTIDYK